MAGETRSNQSVDACARKMEQQKLIRELFGDISDVDGPESAPDDRGPCSSAGLRLPPRVGTSIQTDDATAQFLADPPPARPPRAARLPQRRERLGRRPTLGPPNHLGLHRAGQANPRPRRPACAAVTAPADQPRDPPTTLAANRVTLPTEEMVSIPWTANRVTLPTGETVSVSWTAVFRNRKYQARTVTGVWVLRFDPGGRLQMCRRK